MATGDFSIHYSPITGVLRVYTNGGSYEGRTPYEGIVCVHFLTDKHAYVWGAHGSITPEIYREGIQQLKSLGIQEIVYERRGRLKTRVI